MTPGRHFLRHWHEDCSAGKVTLTHHGQKPLSARSGLLSIEQAEDPAELRLTGELDLTTTPALSQAVGVLRYRKIWDIVLDV